MSTVWNVSVELADGKTFEVKADQRDVAKFEIHPDGCSFYAYQTRPLTFLRFLAWNAGRRAGQHALTWEEFGEECVSVEDLDGDEAAPESDPGQPEASAGT